MNACKPMHIQNINRVVAINVTTWKNMYARKNQKRKRF